jgi:TRAP-type mannitol/chloroaromatic compound transport system permease large subunit
MRMAAVKSSGYLYHNAFRVYTWEHPKVPQRCIGHMSSRNVAAVALVILLGLVIGVLGLVEADLYTVGVLILFIGAVGVAVLFGEYLIWYFSTRRPS